MKPLGNPYILDDHPDAVRVGYASVSTWGIGAMRQSQATGTIKLNGVQITGD